MSAKRGGSIAMYGISQEDKIALNYVPNQEPVIQNYHPYQNVPIVPIYYDTPYETPEGKNIGITKHIIENTSQKRKLKNADIFPAMSGQRGTISNIETPLKIKKYTVKGIFDPITHKRIKD
jgi:hypothetical protein